METYKKIRVVYGFLVILVMIALGVRFFQSNKLKSSNVMNNTVKTKTSDKKVEKKVSWTGKISLASDTTSFKVGDSVNLTVFMDAKGKKLDGADVVILFDPKILTAIGFSEGKSFNIYPRKDIDNEKGIVKVTALDSTSIAPFVTDKVVLGVLQMQAKSTGTSLVNFDFLAGGTNKTTLTEQGTSQNILGEAIGVTITVTE